MQIGYVMARVYTSDAQIPIRDATFTVVSEKDGKQELIGVRITDENGKTLPIPVETPDENLSTVPGNFEPFSRVNVRVDHPGYNTFYVEGVQVFAGQVSVQNAEMIPTAEYIPYNKKSDSFIIDSNNML